jgi:hypothetical protein
MKGSPIKSKQIYKIVTKKKNITSQIMYILKRKTAQPIK